MIVFVTTTKPFNDSFYTIQKNAILSWKKLNIEKRIIVLSDDLSAKQFCDEHDIICLPIKNKSEKTNIPKFNGLYEEGIKNTGDNDVMCIINADIILNDSFVDTVNKFKESLPNENRFLLVGQRIDCNFNGLEIDYNKEDWRSDIPNGVLHSPSGVDYFVMSNKTFSSIPDFYISRFNYDGWIIGSAFNDGVKCVDCTATIEAIHQNHGYGENGDMSNAQFANQSSKEIQEEIQHNRQWPHSMSMDKLKIKSTKNERGEIVFTER